MGVDVSELRALADRMREAAASAPALASKIVRKTAFDIERDAKHKVPKVTHNLQNSIGTDIAPNGLSAVIGPTAHYGGYVEYGTSKMAARPYMNWAADRRIPKMVEALKKVVNL